MSQEAWRLLEKGRFDRMVAIELRMQQLLENTSYLKGAEAVVEQTILQRHGLLQSKTCSKNVVATGKKKCSQDMAADGEQRCQKSAVAAGAKIASPSQIQGQMA